MTTAITERDMAITEKETPVNALLALAACIFFMAAHLIPTSRLLPASRIEEGTVVQRTTA